LGDGRAALQSFLLCENCSDAVCGNGVVEAGEDCDGGPMCTASCRFVASLCGTGILEAGEECDDANCNNGDGCSDACRNEP
jgi:cysteine-rich repeat protein